MTHRPAAGGPVRPTIEKVGVSETSGSPAPHRAASDDPPTATEPADTGSTRIDVRSVSLSVIAVAVAIALVKYMSEVLIPLVLAALLFYALDPFVDRMERWRVPRAVGAAFIILVLVFGAGFFAWSLSDDLSRVISDLPAATQKLRLALRSSRQGDTGTLDKLQQAADELQKTAEEAAAGQPTPGVTRVEVTQPFSASAYLWSGSTQMLVYAGQAIMILFLAYFLLLSDDLFKRKLVEIIGPTMTKKKLTVEILNEVAAQIERFLLIQAGTSLVVGVVTGVVLWWLGVRQPGVWGLMAGVLNSVPYFGPVIVTVVLSVVAYVQFGTPAMVLAVSGASLLITTLEGWVLTPMLMGRMAQVNTVAVFASLIFWSWMWGLAGLLLAVPMLVVMKAICDRVQGLEPFGRILGE